MKVSDTYQGAYLSVNKWPTKPEEHEIQFVGSEADRFSKTDGEQVIYLLFDDGDTKIRLNKTNAQTLVAAWGDETDGWIGKRVTIHRVQAIVRGKQDFNGIVTPLGAKPKK